MLQPVAANGYTLKGNATTILNHSGTADDEEGSDDGIVEAPSLVKEGSTYFLFFSPGYVSRTMLSAAVLLRESKLLESSYADSRQVLHNPQLQGSLCDCVQHHRPIHQGGGATDPERR